MALDRFAARAMTAAGSMTGTPKRIDPSPRPHRLRFDSRVPGRQADGHAAASGFETSSSDRPSAAVPQIQPTTEATAISAAPMR